MKKFIVGLIALAITSSCRSNDDTSNPSVAEKVPVLPTTITAVNNNSQSQLNYFYIGDKLKEVTTSSGNRYKYIYNGDNIIREELYKGGELKMAKDFSYSNDKVASVKVTNESVSPAVQYIKNIQYLDANHIKYDAFDDNGNIEFQIEAYFDNNGNLIKIDLPEKLISTFDLKNNPLKNIRGYYKIYMVGEGINELEKINFPGNNNLLNIKLSSSMEVMIENTISYNDKGYPTKNIQLDNTEALTTTIDYQYND
ncbi:hypothetical protein ACP3T3_00675 [Chryseobacterium sp. CBSDS_008]|uniref:hypothetical protein n=1 Tax=Chryseobacterium sp. CBSDS_008 TaxID=3415265 RepID=UPI003CEC7140